jgi:DNA-binding transcriptional MerR regulator
VTPDGHPQPGPEAVLGVAAVARRLGVATGTLRTWDRRYGVGPTHHPAGTRRRYTGQDLARLEVMRRLMLDGVTPAEAARVALAYDGDGDDPLEHRPATRRRRPHERGGGGRVVPLRDATPAARGLARAAMSLDGDGCTEMLVAALRRKGVAATWTEMLVPVLAGLGERWRTTGRGIEVEHLLSESAEAALRSGSRARPTRPGARPVLLAALEPEDHRLPLVVLSAALGEVGVPVRMLGPRLPVIALADAVARTGPVGVFLWSSGARGPATLPGPERWSVRPRPAVLLGGPGWEAHRFHPGVTWLADLEDAVRTIVSLTSVPSAATGAR